MWKSNAAALAAFLFLEIGMTRIVNAAALKIAEESEGCELIGYRDPVGRPTAGHGHTGPEVKIGQVYSQTQADAWLATDMAAAAAAVERLVKVDLSDNQFSALAEFTFNVGAGNLAGSTLLRRLNGGDYAAVPAQLMRWTKARVDGRETVLPGLVARRAREAALFSASDLPATAPAAGPNTEAIAPSWIEQWRAWWSSVTRAHP
jgi:lysozyme